MTDEGKPDGKDNIIPYIEIKNNGDDFAVLAKRLAVSTLLPKHLTDKDGNGRVADIFYILMYGSELGLSPMQSIMGIYSQQGRPTLSADLAVGIVRGKNACKYFKCVETTAEKAIYETWREGEDAPAQMVFTIEQAKKAGLLNKDTWQKYPDAMLRARAKIALVRDKYSDIVHNVYDPDEIPAAPIFSAAPIKAANILETIHKASTVAQLIKLQGELLASNMYDEQTKEQWVLRYETLLNKDKVDAGSIPEN